MYWAVGDITTAVDLPRILSTLTACNSGSPSFVKDGGLNLKIAALRLLIDLCCTGQFDTCTVVHTSHRMCHGVPEKCLDCFNFCHVSHGWAVQHKNPVLAALAWKPQVWRKSHHIHARDGTHTYIYIYIPAKPKVEEMLQQSTNRTINPDSRNSPGVLGDSRNGTQFSQLRFFHSIIICLCVQEQVSQGC